MAFARLDAASKVLDFPVRQLVREGQIAEQALLPSALYSPMQGENPGLESEREWIVGQYARWRGARVPGRLITSAKSWLCHPAIDRAANILPWGGAADVARISPVRASGLLLEHLRASWNEAHAADPLEKPPTASTSPVKSAQCDMVLMASLRDFKRPAWHE